MGTRKLGRFATGLSAQKGTLEMEAGVFQTVDKRVNSLWNKMKLLAIDFTGESVYNGPSA
jgi:hypothetical protein